MLLCAGLRALWLLLLPMERVQWAMERVQWGREEEDCLKMPKERAEAERRGRGGRGSRRGTDHLCIRKRDEFGLNDGVVNAIGMKEQLQMIRQLRERERKRKKESDQKKKRDEQNRKRGSLAEESEERESRYEKRQKNEITGS